MLGGAAKKFLIDWNPVILMVRRSTGALHVLDGAFGGISASVVPAEGALDHLAVQLDEAGIVFG